MPPIIPTKKTQCNHCLHEVSRTAPECPTCSGPPAGICRHPNCNKYPTVEHEYIK
ncbi:hypothetical protein P154DRAFT_517148 [Amniculicola lignicola CBS 123094]|uniref:Uncharacterized protein n=1 Tax=Amniculicola lignicola CBS 123094 TaxID=1392246 RepID=A0A6A5X3C4_9PLEO|nr:hypothetical protein P154DRAFT_517148 [Amniculicola lignicola CBS 123094]